MVWLSKVIRLNGIGIIHNRFCNSKQAGKVPNFIESSVSKFYWGLLLWLFNVSGFTVTLVESLSGFLASINEDIFHPAFICLSVLNCEMVLLALDIMDKHNLLSLKT